MFRTHTKCTPPPRAFLLAVFLAVPLYVAANPVSTAGPTRSEVEALRRQLEALRGNVENLQQQLNRQRLEQPYAAAPRREPGPGGPPAVASFERLESASAGVGKGSNAGIQPSLSVALDVVGSYSRKQDNMRLTPRDAELGIQANVDPFVRAYVVVNAGSELAPAERQDAFGEVVLSLEEAAVETTGLPFGLQLKAGQFFADFTRLGKVHPHDLPFVDHPPVLEALNGGETKGRGVELNWVPALSTYIKFTLGAVDRLGAERSVLGGFALNRESGAVFHASENRGLGALTYYGRGASVLELGESVLVHVGSNLLRGREEGTRTLWGADAKLVWRLAGGSEAEVGGEFLSGTQEGALLYPLDGVDKGGAKGKGGYVYAQYRIGKTWTPGVRLDVLRTRTLGEVDSTGGNTPDSLAVTAETRRAVSGYLGCRISEYQRLRLQLTYANSNQPISGDSKRDLQALLQWTILLGNHQHAFTP